MGGYGVLRPQHLVAQRNEIGSVKLGWPEKVPTWDKEATRLCDGIRDWPGRADALIGECPEHPARLVSLREWRRKAEPLFAEARAMQAEDGPHAPHLKAMPPEREALVGATDRLAWALLAVEVREMNLLATVAQRSADETGGIACDADAYADLMERVRALNAWSDLPSDLRETVLDHLERDEGWTADRKRVGGFLEAAREVDSARNGLDEMARTGSVPAEQLPKWDGWRRDVEEVLREAGTLKSRIPGRELTAHLGAVGASQDAVDKAEEGIAERIARDEAARAAAAEAERQAREQARLAAEQARAAQIGETREPVPAAPGRPAREDYEYRRCGSCNVFMATEPLAGRRMTKVTARRTKTDWAHFLNDIAERHRDAKRITLVMDNLNTHRPGALYEAFPPAEAKALWDRFEFVYTPKHGSWLNVAEVELSVMIRQCLNRRIASLRVLRDEVAAWQASRDRIQAKVNWQFTTNDARVNLKRLYPTLDE